MGRCCPFGSIVFTGWQHVAQLKPKLDEGAMFRSPKLLAAACATTLGIALIARQAAAGPSCPSASWVTVERKASSETRPVRAGPHHRIFVRRTPITTTADITEIKLAGDAYDTLVLLKFTPEAAQRLHDATTNKSGLHIAFVVDDLATSAVTWTGPYGVDADLGVQLSLRRPTPEVRSVVEAIQGCIGSNAR